MALITKMHRCAFCGSSEVTVSENGTYTCHMNSTFRRNYFPDCIFRSAPYVYYQFISRT